MSEVKVNKVSPRSGTTLTIGDSGDTTNVVGTLQNNGAALVGDISSVVAGTNLSGGGTSGAVTINLADASTSAKGASSFSSDNFAASSGAITIKDLGVATAEIQDDAVTLGKMASGTDGNIISYDTSGNPVAVATGSSGQVLTSAGAGAIPTFATIETGIAWQSSIVTASTITVVAGRGYWINTTSNACTITLPSSASVGDQLIFTDYARKWGTNAVTINQNSLKFQGNTSPNPIYNTSGQSVDLVYSGATNGWIPNSDDDVTLETPQTYNIDLLVVAGGGSGAKGNSGGGGGGGMRTTTYSNVPSGTNFTVTVGDGAAGVGAISQASNGSASSIAGSGFTTISSAGGGGGGNGSGQGLAGGSGGGDGYNASAPGGAGNTPSTSPSQGAAGGNGASADPAYGAGGGGGGGASGVAGGNGSGSAAGNGGNGTQSSITGSAVYYAGGGGGAADNNVGASGDGGSGGGGAGGTGGGGRADTYSDATANTGGGGGGHYNAPSRGGNGGKGVIILSMPDASYSGTTSGSPNVTTGVSGKTIIKFLGSGSYTA